MKQKSKKFIFGGIIGFTLTLLIIIGVRQPIIAQGSLGWLFGNDTESLSNEDIEAITQVYESIQALYIEDVDKDALVQGALKGMVQATEDPYSEFLNVDQAEEMNNDVEGSFTGIGVQFQMTNDRPTIIAPIEGTPASEAGLMPNDIILEADGHELTGLDTNEIVKYIRGEVGTTVDLVIQRGDATFDVTIERAEIPIITVEGEIDPEQSDIGYVNITQFNGTTAEELETVVTDLRNQGAKRFVFDLRYNPGGLLDQALTISNMFLEDGQNIMQMEETGAEKVIYTADDAEYGNFQIDEPYVFLINVGSASASEILAAAVAENNNTPLIGQTTFGKGSVQTVIPQGDYGELKLTIAKWLTPNGQWIHEEGVAATEEVDANPLEGAILLQSDKAYQIGDSDPAVLTIGTVLDLLDYDLQSLEYYDESMEKAVKAFQEENELEPTGIVTDETATLINEEARRLLEEIDPQYDHAFEILNEITIEHPQAA
ncbi:S41 family peptidase [Aerococcaceae bacterium DSM 111020]|nr:S41 family peptidase [Aerococcaceae bacterium DSM 111020]